MKAILVFIACLPCLLKLIRRLIDSALEAALKKEAHLIQINDIQQEDIEMQKDEEKAELLGDFEALPQPAPLLQKQKRGHVEYFRSRTESMGCYRITLC